MPKVEKATNCAKNPTTVTGNISPAYRAGRGRGEGGGAGYSGKWQRGGNATKINVGKNASAGKVFSF